MLANAPALGALAARLVVAFVMALPVVSLVASGAVSTGLKVIVAAVLVAGVAAPVVAAIATVVFLLTAPWTASTFGGLTPTQLAEAVVFASAAGALARTVVRPARNGVWLEAPAVVLGVAIAASVIDDLFALSVIRPQQPFLADLWHHLIGDYWGDTFTDWPSLHRGMRWIARLVIAVDIERTARQSARMGRFMVRAVVVGAAGATLLTVHRLIEVVGRLEGSGFERVLWLLGDYRVSALHPDPNAAGSLFGLLLVTAAVCVWRERRLVFAVAALPLLTLGFVMAKSRAAVGAAILVAGAAFLHRTWGARRFAWGLVAFVAISGAAAAWMMTSRAHVSASHALQLRLQMAVVGVHMVERFPLFGVGLGDYARVSRRFIPDEYRELASFAPGGENAHNNFLQIAVELGLPALGVFLVLVGSVFVSAWRHGVRGAPPEYAGLVMGLAIFLVSALFGHPLLTFEVAAMFTLALGLAAGVQPDVPRPHPARTAITWVAALAFLVSLAWRV